MKKQKLVTFLCIIQLLIGNHHERKSVIAETVLVANYQPGKSDAAIRRSINDVYNDAFTMEGQVES